MKINLRSQQKQNFGNFNFNNKKQSSKKILVFYFVSQLNWSHSKCKHNAVS